MERRYCHFFLNNEIFFQHQILTFLYNNFFVNEKIYWN